MKLAAVVLSLHSVCQTEKQRYRAVYRNSMIFQIRHSKGDFLQNACTAVTVCLKLFAWTTKSKTKCYKTSYTYSVLTELDMQSYRTTHLKVLELHIDFELVRL